MKKNLIMLGAALMCYTGSFAQRCGMQAVQEAMIAKDPTWAQRLTDQKNALQGAANNYLQQAAGTVSKTTTVSPIPVIFHIVVTSSELTQLGGTAGVAKRCDSQITVLNRDFNRQNLDSGSIPTGWKPLFGNAGIRFGLAHTDPSGHATPGYEIKIVTTSNFTNIGSAFPEAKTAATGLDAWDVARYLNVWCINFTGAASDLLGIATPKSQTGGWGGFPVDEMGICIKYTALGKKTTGAGTFPTPYDQGRTLTHETGHFFEIWHTWGDDNGACPWDASGQDDGIADTPPQSDATSGAPTYTITGGTVNDGCKLNGATDTQPIGIACLSYMDYTDDKAMYLFTTQQAAAMAANILPTGESYTLTQNPTLLLYPVSVADVDVNNNLGVYPNPTTGQVNISLSGTTETLNEITVYNIMGQQVTKADGKGQNFYSIDLSGMSKGIYFVKCNFASGIVTRKIMLQ